MITERILAGRESKTTLDDTVKIIDEMDRLLNEMKETMGLIKRILGEEDGASVSPDWEGTRYRQIENFVRSS